LGFTKRRAAEQDDRGILVVLSISANAISAARIAARPDAGRSNMMGGIGRRVPRIEIDPLTGESSSLLISGRTKTHSDGNSGMM
jgi:hypothetical protein